MESIDQANPVAKCECNDRKENDIGLMERRTNFFQSHKVRSECRHEWTQSELLLFTCANLPQK